MCWANCWGIVHPHSTFSLPHPCSKQCYQSYDVINGMVTYPCWWLVHPHSSFSYPISNIPGWIVPHSTFLCHILGLRWLIVKDKENMDNAKEQTLTILKLLLHGHITLFTIIQLCWEANSANGSSLWSKPCLPMTNVLSQWNFRHSERAA